MKISFAVACCILFAGMVKSDDSSNDVITWLIETSKNTEVERIVNKLAKKKITPRILFNAKGATGIEMRSRLPYLQQWIQEKIATEYNINIEVAFKLLGKVGDLLRISYAGCKGYDCQVNVADVHSQYQNMIHDSASVSNFFVKSTVRALRYHKYAHKNIGNDKISRALRWIKKCEPIADNLVVQSTRMVKQSDHLKNLTEKAYLKTHGNDVENTEEIKKTKERHNYLTERTDRINKMLEELLKREGAQIKLVGETDVELQKHEDEYKKVKSRDVKVNEICKTDVVNGASIPGLYQGGQKVIRTCHTELDAGDVEIKKSEMANVVKKINQIRRNQLELLQIKNAIQKNMTQLYGELAGGITGLSHTKAKGNDLQRARKALQMAIETLGIVKTIFLNNRHYWIQVTHNAGQQGSDGDTSVILKDLDHDEIEEIEEMLMESGFNWLALGKVSRDALISMNRVKNHVDQTLINLPSHEQAKGVIESSHGIIKETKELIKALAKQTQVLEKEIEEAERAVKEGEKEVSNDDGDEPDPNEEDDLTFDEDEDDLDMLDE